MNNISLPLSHACVQGSTIIFVGILSVIVLKRRLEWFRWTGIAVVVCGITMVGGADFIKTGDLEEEEGALNQAVIGDIIIVCAQVMKLVMLYVF